MRFNPASRLPECSKHSYTELPSSLLCCSSSSLWPLVSCVCVCVIRRNNTAFVAFRAYLQFITHIHTYTAAALCINCCVTVLARGQNSDYGV